MQHQIRYAMALAASLCLWLACSQQSEPISAIEQRLEDCPGGCTCTCEGGSAGASAGSAGTSGSGGSTSGAGGATAGSSGSAGAPSSPCNLAGYTTGTWRQVATQPQAVGTSNHNVRFSAGIAVDTNAPGTLYATFAGYNDQTWNNVEGGLYRTTDCGATWTELGAFNSGTNVEVNPGNGAELYFGNGVRGSMGFWYSADAGATWTKRTLGNPAVQGYDDVQRVAVDPSDWSRVILSFHYPGSSGSSGLLVSGNKGVTWTPIAPQSGWGSGNIIHAIDSSTWLLGTQGSGWYRTTDSGSTWSQVLTTLMSHGGSRLWRDDLGALWVATACGGARSTNSGATWTGTGGGCSNWGAIGGVNGRLYTSPFYAGAIYSTLESAPTSWTSLASAPDASHQYALDSGAGLLYASMWGGGIWALKY